MDKGSCADGGDLARFLQALAEESTLSHRASEVSSQSAMDSSNSFSSPQLRSREGSQHGLPAGPTEVPAAAQRAQQQDPAITDSQLSEMLHQISCSALSDPISTGGWQASQESILDSPGQGEGTELRARSMDSMRDLGSELPGGASRTSHEGTGGRSTPSGLLEVKQQQVGPLIISFPCTALYRPCSPSSPADISGKSLQRGEQALPKHFSPDISCHAGCRLGLKGGWPGEGAVPQCAEEP